MGMHQVRPTASNVFTSASGPASVVDKQPILIGMTGKARSGKDTVGGMLIETYGFQQVFFAQPLKDGLKVMLGLTDHHVYGDLKEEVLPDFGKSPRQMLQTLGTDWGRQMVEDSIWLTVARRKIETLMAQGYNVVVTDVRFENESTMIRSMGGSVWHVRRPGAQVVNAHASEAGVLFHPSEDHILDNSRSLEDLADLVDETYKSVLHNQS